MNTRNAFLAVAAGALVFASQMVLSDGDHERKSKDRTYQRSTDVAMVNNAEYAKECGECHFAYQPGLLPDRSWRKIMGGLTDHFGDNAELDKTTSDRLLRYLVENSAEHDGNRRPGKILASLRAGDMPLRISETPYFVRKHDEVPQRMVKQNEKVGSLSNCAACHTRAAEGSYSEREIKIPGVGRWEDD